MSKDNPRIAPAAFSIGATQVIYSARLKARYREIQELRQQVREAELAALMSRNRWPASVQDDELH